MQGCPNIVCDIVTPPLGFYVRDEGGRYREIYFLECSRHHPCGHRGYRILERGVFTEDSGYDPEGMKIKCTRCGFEYYLFPKKVKVEV